MAGAADADGYLDRVLATLGDRFSSLLTLPEQIGFFFSEDHWIDQAAWQEHAAATESRRLLAALADAVADRSWAPTPGAHGRRLRGGGAGPGRARWA